MSNRPHSDLKGVYLSKELLTECGLEIMRLYSKELSVSQLHLT